MQRPQPLQQMAASGVGEPRPDIPDVDQLPLRAVAGQEQRAQHMRIGGASAACRNSVYGYWYETIEPCRLRHRWSCVRVIVLGWRP